MKVTIREQSLTDSSKVYDVLVTDDNGDTIEIPALSKGHAEAIDSDFRETLTRHALTTHPILTA